MKKIVIPFLGVVALVCGGLALQACNSLGEIDPAEFVISPTQEVELGQQVAAEIRNNPDQFPILDEDQYTEAYGHIHRILDALLASPEMDHLSEFAYDSIKIIHDDSVLNAFATPGGFIFVYTGLIKYLDSEDHLAGVLGHEIAHAERHHSRDALIRQVGLELLKDIILGEENSGQIAQVLTGITQLQFGREAENEADAYSVIYLSNDQAPYQCNGAAGFFEKLESQGQGSGIPEFLSTHPSPENRIADINAKSEELGCDTTALNPDTYAAFKASLPQ